MVASVSAGGGDNARPPWNEIPGQACPERLLMVNERIAVTVLDHVYSTGVAVGFRVRFGGEFGSAEAALDEELGRIMRSDGSPGRERLSLSVRRGSGEVIGNINHPGTPQTGTLPITNVQGRSRIWRVDFWLAPRPESSPAYMAEWPEMDLPMVEFRPSNESWQAALKDIRSVF